ncbi:MAG: 4Fe-4S dicluster domain-containing protein [Desulfovibrionaceae bacterium]
MRTSRFLPTGDLSRFLTECAAAQQTSAAARVLVPVRQGRAVVFAPYAEGVDCVLERATSSPKRAVLPPCETLMTYKRAKDPENLDHVTLSLDDSPESVPTVLLGGRPCDARGFVVLDNPYLHGPFADPYYAKRRDSLTVITQTCSGLCNTCFCHWVGSGPTDEAGSDIMMTALDGGWVLTSCTDKGAALLASSSLQEDAPKAEAAAAARAAVKAATAAAPDLSAAKDALAARFDDMDFWYKQTAHCLSCGACTYLCPTCYCFTITDEGDGMGEQSGKRLRSWDTCMSSLFTREASGHNPRLTKAMRMRNRIMHKFSYYPGIWQGAFSCNGCGRCISHCPVHLDIRAIVQAAIAEEQK